MAYTRRRVLRLAAAGVVSAGASSVAGGWQRPASGRSFDESRTAESTGATTVASRVLTVEQDHCTVEPIGTIGTFPSSTESIPLVGFPAGASPRPGDFVAVTDYLPGYAWAALPLCSWYDGVPERQPDSSYTLADHETVRGELVPAGVRGDLDVADAEDTPVFLCLLDTGLADAVALTVRQLDSERS